VAVDDPGPGRARPLSPFPLATTFSLVLVIVLDVKFPGPAQVTDSDEEAPVADSVAQFRGLFAKDPLTVPPVMLTAGLVVVQPDNVPVTPEGLVPPPVRVSAGENVTLAESAQVTPPGAAPDNPAGPDAHAEADGAITAARPPTTTIAHNTRHRRMNLPPPGFPRQRAHAEVHQRPDERHGQLIQAAAIHEREVTFAGTSAAA